jgi:prolyl oligopeptidase
MPNKHTIVRDDSLHFSSKPYISRCFSDMLRRTFIPILNREWPKMLAKVRAIHIRITLTAVLLAAISAAAQKETQVKLPAPPETPVRDIKETFFGTDVTDPYRWLEDLKSPEVTSWMRAQNDYTRAVLDRIPSRDKLRSRIAQLDDAGTRVNSLQSFGDRLFYLKQSSGEENRKLFVRDTPAAPERLLLDPQTRTANGVHFSIDYFQASPDGKLVAVGISPGGSENSVLHVLDAATGQEAGPSIDRAQFGAVFWLPDNRTFFYNRLRKPAADDPRTSYYLNSKDFLHHVGDDPEKDVPIFGNGLSASVTINESDFPFVSVPAGSKYAFGVIAHGVQNEITLYVTSLASLHDATASWRKIADTGDEVTGFDIHGDRVFLLSHHEASRFKISEVTLPKDEVSHARVLLPATDAVVTNIQAAADALYVQKLDGGLGRLWRVPYEGGAAANIKLPIEGALQEMFVNPTEPGVYLRVASWTKSSLFYHYDPKTNALTDTKIIPPSPVDFSGIASEEVKAKAPDGTLVPLSIVHQRGLKMDGSHPTLLHGYGSYGITYDPAFDPTSLAWLERGGVIAVAHIRGGGEYGEDWHNAGRKGTKKNTITDFLGCAQYLIDHKYTSPQHLAGEGTSAGGITIGGAITERPDLFGAALDNVGMSDDLRAELQVNGPANIPEFGTSKNAEDFKNLLAISAFHRLKDHTAYPAVLLTTGINDPRVDPWQMNKMTARLQAATSSGKPVLLRVDYDAGHGGIGATKSQHTALLTDQYSFLLWQLGDPEFAVTDAAGSQQKTGGQN